MEKKLFDRIEQAIEHMREIDELWFGHIYDDPSYNDPNGQVTVPSKVLKELEGFLKISISLLVVPQKLKEVLLRLFTQAITTTTTANIFDNKY